MVDRGDTDNDGSLDVTEIRRLARVQASATDAPEPGGRGGYMRGDPLLAALDANGDGVISADDIANAPAALKTLDRNSDKQLTPDELRPAFGRGRRDGESRPPERQ